MAPEPGSSAAADGPPPRASAARPSRRPPPRRSPRRRRARPSAAGSAAAGAWCVVGARRRVSSPCRPEREARVGGGEAGEGLVDALDACRGLGRGLVGRRGAAGRCRCALRCARPAADRGPACAHPPPGRCPAPARRARRNAACPCRPVVACVRSPDSADEPGLRRRPFVACGARWLRRRTCAREGRRPARARWLRRRARACAREGRRPACALPPPYRSPACARPGPRWRPAARLRRGVWPALASSLRPFARCGVGSEPALAPAEGLRPVARICGGVWSAASGRRLRALARCGVEVLPALGPAIAVRPVARLGGGVWPALTSGCRPRTRLREGAGFRPRALRPAVLAGARIRCGAGLAVTPAVRPSAVGACSSVRRLLRRVPGRQSSRLAWAAVRPRRGPTVRPRRCPSARRRRCGRPAVRPELSSLVRPVPRRRRAAVHLGSGRPTVRAGRRRPTVRRRHRRPAGGRPVPVLVPPAFLAEAGGLPARPAARIRPGRAGQRNPRAAEADLPDSRAGGAGSPSRRAGEAASVHTRAARAGRPDRYAGPSRPWAARADRPGAAAALAPIDPLGRSAARIAAGSRLGVARPPRPRGGAPRDRPGAGWRRSARAGRGRRRCRAAGDARRARIRTVRHATSPRRTRQRAGEIATISLPPPLTRTSLRTPSNPITGGSRRGVAG